jgi:hypothetical protein
MRPHIELNIEELVLHGFDRRDRFRIGQAVEQALAQLLTGQDATALSIRSGSIPSVQAPGFQAKPNAKPETTGAQIAQSVYSALSTSKPINQ